MCQGSGAVGRQIFQAVYKMAKVSYILQAAEWKVNEQFCKSRPLLSRVDL
jgi:hypothetical protein